MDSSTIQTPVDHLYRELEQLKIDNESKRLRIRILRRKIDEIIHERNALNDEVKNISAQVKKVKSERDALNEKVKALKQKRDELRTVAAQKRETLQKLLEQARRTSEQLHGTMSELATQIEQLEWFIQTNPLAQKTERNLVARISALELSLAKHKGLKTVRDKLVTLKVEVGRLRMQAQATHEELTKIAQESEKAHAAMQKLITVLAEKKKTADAKHAEYVEVSKQRVEAANALKANLQRIDQIRTQIGEAKISSKIEKAERVKSKYKETANKKLRAGKKLSFEEFQALIGDTLSDSDEE